MSGLGRPQGAAASGTTTKDADQPGFLHRVYPEISKTHLPTQPQACWLADPFGFFLLHYGQFSLMINLALAIKEASLERLNH
jgi:hypothetical protein